MQELQTNGSSVAISLARVKAWLENAAVPRTQIAAEAGIDEKTLRLARSPKWNPTAKTLQRIEAIIPHSWQPPAPRKRRAAA